MVKSFVETLHAGFSQRSVNVLVFTDAAVEMLMASVQSHPISTCTKDVCEELSVRARRLPESSDP